MFDINVLEVLTFGAVFAALLIAARALKINEDAWQLVNAQRREPRSPEPAAESGTILSAVSANQAATAEVGHKVDHVQAQLRGIVTSAAEQHLATHRTERTVEAVQSRMGEMQTQAGERHAETIKEIRKKPRTVPPKKKEKTGSGSGTSRGRRGGGKNASARPKDDAAPAAPATPASEKPETPTDPPAPAASGDATS